MQYEIYPFGPGAVLIKNPGHPQAQPYGLKQIRVEYGPLQQGVETLGICFPPHDSLRHLIPFYTKVTDILNGVTGLPFVDIAEWNAFFDDYLVLGSNKEVYSHQFVTAGGAANYTIPGAAGAELLLVLGLPSSFEIGNEVTVADDGDDAELTFNPVPPNDLTIIAVYKKAV
jgi:hypothetical protein